MLIEIITENGLNEITVVATTRQSIVKDSGQNQLLR